MQNDSSVQCPLKKSVALPHSHKQSFHKTEICCQDEEIFGKVAIGILSPEIICSRQAILMTLLALSEGETTSMVVLVRSQRHR